MNRSVNRAAKKEEEWYSLGAWRLKGFFFVTRVLMILHQKDLALSCLN